MRFLVDASVSHRICPPLREAGHDAVHLDQDPPVGGDGQPVISKARDEGRVIISDDVGLEYQLAGSDTGVSLILLCDDTLQPDEIAPLLLAAMTPTLKDVLAAGGVTARLDRDQISIRAAGF